MAAKLRPVVPDGYRLIFRPWIRTKDGRVLWARAYGKRAWPVLIREQK